MIKRFFLIAIPAILMMMTGCIDYVDQAEVDENKILEYLKTNGLEAQKTETSVYYIVQEPGAVAKPLNTSTVKVHYTGKLLDGTVFDSSYTSGKPIEMPLSNLIVGWQIGIPLFGKGGKGTLFIPSRYGYGDVSVNKIPANSVLLFEIYLIDFQ